MSNAECLSGDGHPGEPHLKTFASRGFHHRETGMTTRFEETILTPAFSPCSDEMSFWIPSNHLTLSFDPAHNLLLSTDWVSDSESGLNRVAKFIAPTSSGRKSS
jgi:hypothetical protein